MSNFFMELRKYPRTDSSSSLASNETRTPPSSPRQLEFFKPDTQPGQLEKTKESAPAASGRTPPPARPIPAASPSKLLDSQCYRIFQSYENVELESMKKAQSELSIEFESLKAKFHSLEKILNLVDENSRAEENPKVKEALKIIKSEFDSILVVMSSVSLLHSNFKKDLLQWSTTVRTGLADRTGQKAYENYDACTEKYTEMKKQLIELKCQLIFDPTKPGTYHRNGLAHSLHNVNRKMRGQHGLFESALLPELSCNEELRRLWEEACAEANFIKVDPSELEGYDPEAAEMPHEKAIRIAKTNFEHAQQLGFLTTEEIVAIINTIQQIENKKISFDGSLIFKLIVDSGKQFRADDRVVRALATGIIDSVEGLAIHTKKKPFMQFGDQIQYSEHLKMLVSRYDLPKDMMGTHNVLISVSEDVCRPCYSAIDPMVPIGWKSYSEKRAIFPIYINGKAVVPPENIRLLWSKSKDRSDWIQSLGKYIQKYMPTEKPSAYHNKDVFFRSTSEIENYKRRWEFKHKENFLILCETLGISDQFRTVESEAYFYHKSRKDLYRIISRMIDSAFLVQGSFFAGSFVRSLLENMPSDEFLKQKNPDLMAAKTLWMEKIELYSKLNRQC